MWRIWGKKAFRSIAVLLAAGLFLTGCQDGSPAREEHHSQEENAQNTDDTVRQPEETGDQPDIAYHEEGNPLTEYLIPDWEIAMRETVGDARLSIQGDPVFYQSGISQLVLVYGENMQELDGVYQQIFSTETGQWTAVEKTEDFEREGINYDYIGAIFPSLGGSLYCSVYRTEEEAYLATFHQEGVGEILTEESIPKGTLLEHNFVDASGRLISYQNSGYPYDMEGAYSANVTFFDEKLTVQGQLAIAGWVLGGIQADEQSPFYLYGYDGEKQPCLWTTDGEKRLLEGLEELDYLAAYAQGGVLCVTDRKGIWTADGEGFRELYHYGDHGYYLDTLYGMCRGEGQTLKILAECDGDLLLLTYDLAKKDFVSSKQEITLALALQNVGLEEAIARFNRRSSEYSVKVMLPGGDEDAESFRSRIQMELAAGRGPDLLGNDVFTDLGTLVSSGYAQCLDGQGFEELGCIEGALEVSRVDQKLYGVPYDFSLDFAAYRAADMEGEDSLTMEELMDKVRNSDAKTLQKYLYGRQLILKFALSDRSNKEYIDWEKGESHLTEEPFLELLEFAGEYGYRTGMDGTLDTGEIYAEATFPGSRGMTGFSSFNDYYNILGTDISVLGYPRTEGYGIYLDTRAIYVNSQSEKKEGAIAFLKYLVSEEAQTKYALYDHSKDFESSGESLWRANYADFPVNEAALERLMEEQFGERPDAQWLDPEVSQTMTYTEKQRQQFLFLVENARPLFDLGEVAVIMEEELDPYFEGTRTAQEVAEILDRRIQLYLDERK